MSRFTVLIPVHNEAANIAPLHAEIVRELAALDYAVVVVDDGSDDGTGDELARHAPEWTVVRTTRVGKSRALELGMERVATDRVVMMDGDLQDDTSAIPALLADLDAGADCAVGCRAKRRDGRFIKRIPSFCFNLWLSLIFGFRFLDINTGLKAFRTDALRKLVFFENRHRFFPLLVFRDGGKVAQRPTRHRARIACAAKFNSPLRFFGGFWQSALLRLGRYDASGFRLKMLRALPALAALLVGAACFQWAANDGYYVNFDAPAFVPPMRTYARDGTLVNTFQPSAREWDVSGEGRQVGHGFLPSLAVGALSPGESYRNIGYTIATLTTLTLAAFALLLGRLRPVRPPRAVFTATTNALLVLAAGFHLNRLHGRPELFAFLFMTAAAWACLSLRPSGFRIAAGILLAAFALTTPVGALLAGLIFIGSLAATLPRKETLRALAVTGAATVAGLAAGFAAYPYSVSDWITGNLRHASVSVVAYESTGCRSWFLSPTAGWSGFALLFAVAIIGAATFARRGRLRQPVALAGVVTALLATCWYFVFRQGFPTYNLQWLIPFGMAGALMIADRLRKAGPRRLLAAVAMIFLTNNALMAGRDHLLRIASLRDGPSADAVRTLANTLYSGDDSRPGFVSAQYFHLFDDDRPLVRLGREWRRVPTPDTAAFILLSQADGRKKAPPELPGWRLVENTWNPGSPRFAGIDTGIVARGFHYALYLPEGAPVPPALKNRPTRLHTAGSESAASNQ